MGDFRFAASHSGGRYGGGNRVMWPWGFDDDMDCGNGVYGRNHTVDMADVATRGVLFLGRVIGDCGLDGRVAFTGRDGNN